MALPTRGRRGTPPPQAPEPPPLPPPLPPTPTAANGWLTRAAAIRLCLASVIAHVLAGALAVGIGFAVDAVIPNTCTGDSCMGTPGLFAGLLSVPLTTYAGWVVALLALRVRHPCLVALVAAAMTLVAAIGTYAVAGASSGPSSGSVAIAAALLIGGPVAGPIAGVTVLGAGWPRVAAIPVTILLLVMAGVILVKVVTPLRQAGTVTKYVPQPYRYHDPTLALQSLNLSPSRPTC